MQTSLRGCDGEMDLSTSGLLGGRTRWLLVFIRFFPRDSRLLFHCIME
jgi:hypothetical protein